MTLPLELKIALRYLKPKRKKGLISFVGAVSIMGITLGVGALIIVLSVMSGFDTHIKRSIVDATPHIYVMSYAGGIRKEKVPFVERKVLLVKDVIAVSPFVFVQGMARSRLGTTGIAIRGVDPNKEKRITNLYKRVSLGSWNCIENKGSIILGKALADQLGVMLGSTITVITASFRVTPFGLFPKSTALTVCGIVETGMYTIDSSIGIVSLKTAEMLSRKGVYTGLEVSVKNIYRATEIAKEISAKLGYPYWTNDWIRMNKPLFSALKLEKFTMFLILTLIVIVASFSIISTLSMTVMDKAKDIAILSAMGMTRNRIAKIFLYEGIIMGLIGVLLGLFLGLGGCFVIAKYKIITLPQDVYYIDHLPVRVEFLDVVLVCLASVIITLISTYFPAKQSTKMSPVEILRYE